MKTLTQQVQGGAETIVGMFNISILKKKKNSVVINVLMREKSFPCEICPDSLIFHSLAHSLLHEESVNGLLLPDELDNQSVQVDEQRSPKATGDAADTQSHTQRD